MFKDIETELFLDALRNARLQGLLIQFGVKLPQIIRATKSGHDQDVVDTILVLKQWCEFQRLIGPATFTEDGDLLSEVADEKASAYMHDLSSILSRDDQKGEG